MRLNQIINEFDPVLGQAMSGFLGSLTDKITSIIQNASAEPVDVTVDKMYGEFYNGFTKAVKDNPAMKQKLGTYYTQFIKTAFKKVGVPKPLATADQSQLVKNGKINKPYIKQLFKQSIGFLPKSKDIAVNS